MSWYRVAQPRKKLINGYYLEYWACCRASPAQPKIEKEEAAPAESSKQQAPSFKLQAHRPALMMPQLKNKIKIERNKWLQK